MATPLEPSHRPNSRRSSSGAATPSGTGTGVEPTVIAALMRRVDGHRDHITTSTLTVPSRPAEKEGISSTTAKVFISSDPSCPQEPGETVHVVRSLDDLRAETLRPYLDFSCEGISDWKDNLEFAKAWIQSRGEYC
jgi:hypothetical protein